MSTSMLVTKMQAAAEERNYACDIHAYPVAEAREHEKDADMVLFIHRYDYQGLSDNPEDIGRTSLIIAKHRNGEIGEIDMMFRASEVRFVDMADSLVGSISDMPVSSAMNDDAPFGPHTDFIPGGYSSGGADFGENQDFM